MLTYIQKHLPDIFQYFVEGLKKLGHNVTKATGWKSVVEAIDRDSDWYYANSDFRRPGSVPAGY